MFLRCLFWNVAVVFGLFLIIYAYVNTREVTASTVTSKVNSFVVTRWIAGFLTNFSRVGRRHYRLANLSYPLSFFAFSSTGYWVREAAKLQIPNVSLSSSAANVGSGATYFIPANLQYFATLFFFFRVFNGALVSRVNVNVRGVRKLLGLHLTQGLRNSFFSFGRKYHFLRLQRFFSKGNLFFYKVFLKKKVRHKKKKSKGKKSKKTTSQFLVDALQEAKREKLLRKILFKSKRKKKRKHSNRRFSTSNEQSFIKKRKRNKQRHNLLKEGTGFSGFVL